MLFDPSTVDHGIVAGGTAHWQPPRAPAARRRPSTDFLTLPDISAEVPRQVTLRWRSETSLNEIALAHFIHGPLRAADVKNPTSAADAFQQAFFAWVRRQMPRKYRRLCFSPCLFDLNAVHDVVEYQYERHDLESKAPIFLAFEMPEERLFEMRPYVARLRAVHPLLLPTAINLVDRASYHTLFIRTPGWFLQEYACWNWDGDENASDEDAQGSIDAMRGWGPECERYLPSAVKPDLYPDELRTPARVTGRRRRDSTLSESELLELRRSSTGSTRTLCTELLALDSLVRRCGKRNVTHCVYSAHPVYSACTLVVDANERVSEILDDLFESESQGGEATTYNGFSPFASTAHEIRQQYADWALTFKILYHLDRVLSLITATA
jgi:PRTRC genetic system protein F